MDSDRSPHGRPARLDAGARANSPKQRRRHPCQCANGEGTAAVSQALVRDGYELTERSVGGRGHSFGRGEVCFDVLAPDGLGSRAQLVTVHDFRTVPGLKPLKCKPSGVRIPLPPPAFWRRHKGGRLAARLSEFSKG